MWLLIDDEGDLNCEVIARTPEAGRKLVALGGWECLSLDHDLDAGEDGSQFARWAIGSKLMPSKVQLVTGHPVGRSNFRVLLKDNG